MFVIINYSLERNRLITFRDSPQMANSVTNTEMTMVSSKLTWLLLASLCIHIEHW